MKKTITISEQIDCTENLFTEEDGEFMALEFVNPVQRLEVNASISFLQNMPFSVNELILQNGCIFYNTLKELLEIFDHIPSHITTLNLSGNLLGYRPFSELLQLFQKLSQIDQLSTVYLYWNALDQLSIDQIRTLGTLMASKQKVCEVSQPMICYVTANQLNSGVQNTLETQSSTTRPSIQLIALGKKASNEHRHIDFESVLSAFPRDLKRTLDFEQDFPLNSHMRGLIMDHIPRYVALFSKLISLSVPIDIWNQITSIYREKMGFSDLIQLTISDSKSNFDSTNSAADSFPLPSLKNLTFLDMQGKDVIFMLKAGSLSAIAHQIENLFLKWVDFSAEDVDSIPIVFKNFDDTNGVNLYIQNGFEMKLLEEYEINQSAWAQIIRSMSNHLNSLTIKVRDFCDHTKSLDGDILEEASFHNLQEIFITNTIPRRMRFMSIDLSIYLQEFTTFKNIHTISISTPMTMDEMGDVLRILPMISQSQLRCLIWKFLDPYSVDVQSFFENDFHQVINPSLPRLIDIIFEFDGLLPILLDIDTKEKQNATFLRNLTEQVFPSIPPNVKKMIFSDRITTQHKSAVYFPQTALLERIFKAIPFSVRTIQIDSCSHSQEYGERNLPSFQAAAVQAGLAWARSLQAAFPLGRLELLGFFKQKISDYLFFFRHLFKASPIQCHEIVRRPLPCPPIEIAKEICTYLVKGDDLERLIYRLESLNRNSFKSGR